MKFRSLSFTVLPSTTSTVAISILFIICPKEFLEKFILVDFILHNLQILFSETGVSINFDARLYLCTSYYRRQWREHYKPHHGHYSRVDGGNQRIRRSRCLLRAMRAGSD